MSSGHAAGPLLLAIESSCDETGIALVEGGRQILSNVVASQVALHAPTGRDRPRRWRRAPTCAGSCRCSTRPGGAPALVGRHRSRGGDPWAGPGWVAAGRDQRREDARVGPRQAARRRQPPRGPPLRRLAPRPGPGRRPRAGVPARRARRLGRPHVPRRDARPPDVPPARADRRRRGGRGVRQGRAAARPRLPGRPGHPARGRRCEPARRRVPARLARRLVRLLVLRVEDGRAPDRRGRAGGRGPARAG